MPGGREREREKGKEKEREGEGGQKKGEKRKYPKEKPQFSCILTLEVTFHWFLLTNNYLKRKWVE